LHEFIAIFVEEIVESLILLLSQCRTALSPPTTRKQTQYQQIDRAQTWLSSLNPPTLGSLFFAPMTKLELDRPRYF
jgi:hypothetical protein